MHIVFGHIMTYSLEEDENVITMIFLIWLHNTVLPIKIFIESPQYLIDKSPIRAARSQFRLKYKLLFNTFAKPISSLRKYKKLYKKLYKKFSRYNFIDDIKYEQTWLHNKRRYVSYKSRQRYFKQKLKRRARRSTSYHFCTSWSRDECSHLTCWEEPDYEEINEAAAVPGHNLRSLMNLYRLPAFPDIFYVLYKETFTTNAITWEYWDIAIYLVKNTYQKNF